MNILFEIRRAKTGDEEQIANVHVQAWQEAYQNLISKDYLDNLTSELPERINNWSKSLVNTNRWCWVAVVNHQIIGFILLGL